MRPMRGRSTETSVLHELVGSLEQGSGGVVVIEGSAGLGKTRLLTELTEFTAPTGIRCVSGAADELDQVSPWLTLMRAFGSRSDAILGASDLASVEGLLDHRLAVIEHLRFALEKASLEAPLLVMLEDLQWADPATLLAVATLPEELFSYPIAWVVTHRPVAEASRLRKVVQRLRSAGAATLRLQALDHPTVLEIANDILGGPADNETSELLVGAGGNPFYVVELLRSTTERRSEDAGPPTRPDADIASGGAVRTHLLALDEEVRHLLEFGAVLGRDFSVTEVAMMSGQPAASWLGAVERALAAEVLQESAEHLAFRHDILREGAYEAIPPATRKALHRDAGRLLQSLGAPATRVSGHFAVGAEAGDEQAIAALSAALGVLAPNAPGSAADVALRLVELIPQNDPRHAQVALTAVGVLGWAGWAEEARTLAEAFLAEQSRPPQVEAMIQIAMRRAWTQKTMTAYPTPAPERLLADPRVAPGLRACLICQELWEPLERGDFDAVEAGFQRTLPLLRKTSDDTEVMSVLAFRVTGDAFEGEMSRGLRRIEEGLPGTVPFTSPVSVGTVECLRAQHLRALGRFDEAREAVVRGQVMAERSGVTFTLCWSRMIMARLLYDQGRLEDAAAEAHETAIVSERFGHVEYTSAGLALALEIAVLQGDRRAADEAAVALSATAHLSPVMTDRHWALALRRAARGNPTAALRALEPVLAHMRSGILVFGRWNADRLPRMTHLAVECGDRDAATLIAQAAAEYAQRNPEAPLLTALAAHAGGIAGADVALLQQAVTGLANCHMPLAEAAAREDLGMALGQARASGEAVEELERALSAYTAMAAHHEAARTRGALYRLGVRKRRRQTARPATGWDSLTPAERNVVEIVAQGLTNRAAATQLFLSPDTVNTHLRHAFTKLGVRSRVELANLVLARQRGEAGDGATSMS